MIRFLQIFVSLALISWIVVTVDLSEVGIHLRNVHMEYIALTLPLIAFDRWLMSAKWNLLLKAQQLSISEWHCFRIYAVSNFVGLFLPATVGADLSRAALAKYEGLPLAEVASSILVERLLGFFALVFMTTVGALLLTLFFSETRFSGHYLLSIATIGSAFFILMIFTSFSQSAQRVIEAGLKRLSSWGKRLEKLSALLGKTYAAYLQYRGHKTTLIVFFALSCLEGATLILLAYVVTLALDIQVNFVYLAACISVVVFIIRLPLSIDGIGVYEKGVQFFLVQVGISASLGLAAGILFHLVCLVALLPGGVIMAFYRRPALP